MATQDDQKPDGAAFDDFFESLGKKAENLTIKEQTDHKDDAPDEVDQVKPNDDEQKVVDEIESLCMNCHENVSCRYFLCALD
jgi:zinc finger protein